MTRIDKNQPPAWRLQSSKRARGSYYQAVIGQGRRRRVVTLGYLTEGEAVAALEALRHEKGPALANVDADGQAVVSDDGIRHWATEVAGEAVVTAMVAEQARQSGDYSRMPLSTFVSEVFMPVRLTEVGAHTRKNEKVQWRKILKVIGSVPVGKITGMIVERLMNHYASDTAPTRRRLLVTLKAALRYAAQVGVIKEIPPMRPVKGANRRVKGRPVALSAAEVEAILREALSPVHKALWAFALGQGVRPSEAARLDWSDVCFKTNMVLVRGTKTAKSHRKIPLTTATRDVLEPYWTSLGSPQTGVAFPGRGGQPVRDWRWGFSQAAKRARVEKKVTAYTARHTFATTCAMQGVPLPAAKEMLGHSTHSKMLEEVYSNPDSQMLAAAVAGLTKLGG